MKNTREKAMNLEKEIEAAQERLAEKKRNFTQTEARTVGGDFRKRTQNTVLILKAHVEVQSAREGLRVLLEKQKSLSSGTNMKTEKELQDIADKWNGAIPTGTPVTRYKLVEPLSEPVVTKTRSPAWVMGGHSVMVMVEGVAGGVLLESVQVINDL